MPTDPENLHERQLVRATRLAPVPVWRDGRRDVYCALVMGFDLPFHRRFLREHPEWEGTRTPIADALDLIWARVADGTAPTGGERLATALRLRSAAPVDEDGMPLPIEGVAATFDLCWILAELLDPIDLETHEVTRAAAREARCVVEQEITRTLHCDWRDRMPNPDPLDHPASLLMEAVLRDVVARLDASPLTPQPVPTMRDEGLRISGEVFRLLLTVTPEDWLTR